MMALAVVLLLQPVLEEAGAVRVVATGVGDEPVTWWLDGVEVARTGDREAAVVTVPAGVHELRAQSAADDRWQAVARPDGDATGAAYVPAWSATHEPARHADHGAALPPLPVLLALAAAALVAWPRRRGLEGRRRARR